MAVPAYKYTNEALAFITLYKAMPPEVKEEVRDIIVHEEKEGSSRKKLSNKEKTLIKGIDQSVDFVNNYKSEKTHHKTYKQMLDEL